MAVHCKPDPRSWLLVSIIIFAACGDDAALMDATPGDASGDASIADGDTGADADAGSDYIVDWGSCPEGWNAVALEGARICEPWAEDVAPCEGEQMRRPGRPGCFDVGPSCPPGTFAEVEPTGPAYFVDASAPGGGSGTRDAPFDSLAAAIAAAGTGSATVLLARGEYEVDGLMDASFVELSIVGACAAETVLSTAAEGVPVRGNLGLSRLRAQLPVVNGDGSIVIDQALVRLQSIEVLGDVTIRDSLIVADGTGAAVFGASVRVERTELRSCFVTALQLFSAGDASLVVEDSAFSGEVAAALAFNGENEFTGAPAQTQTTIRRTWFSGRFAGVGAGPGATIEDVIIRAPEGNAFGLLFGYDEGEGTTEPSSDVAHVARVFIHSAGGQGIFTEQVAVEVEDAVIQVIAEVEQQAQAIAVGAVAANGASLTMRRFVVSDSDVCGVQVDAADLDLADGIVSGSAIGACVQVPDYDLDRLTERVSYVDNGTNLDATTLPVPDPMLPTL